MFQWMERGCRKYQMRMEECLGVDSQVMESDQELSAHLRECGKCREAFAAAQLSQQLFAGAEVPEVPVSEAFVTRVMASVREADATLAPSPVWRPLEILASRFALVSAVVLLALSVFLGEFSPALRQPEAASITPASNEVVVGDWPEPPAQPATQDEVLMSLVDVDNGI
jgi:hypothetical protein